VSRAYGFGGVCRENQGQELFESGSGVGGVHLSAVELHLHGIGVPVQRCFNGDRCTVSATSGVPVPTFEVRMRKKRFCLGIFAQHLRSKTLTGDRP
jgi:hypothetical protein